MSSAVAHLTRAVRHPLVTVARAVGLAKGAAGAVVRLAVPEPGHRSEDWAPPARASATDARTPTSPAATAAPAVVPAAAPAPAAPQRAPHEPGESYATEPTAVSRTSAHGGGGTDAELDDWYGEREDEDDDEPQSIVEILESNDPPSGPVDQAAIKAVLAENEILRGGAAAAPDDD
ncbi:MAG: hypothetical protein ACJ72E_03200 [Marmoricola sp.]